MPEHERIEAFPLTWPNGVKRTTERKTAPFSTKDQGRTKPLTVAVARERIYREFELLEGVTNLIISTNVELTLRGGPRSGLREPADLGRRLSH